MTRPSIESITAKSAKNRKSWAGKVESVTFPELPPARHEQKIAKYRNVKSSEGDSRKEVRRLHELRLMQRAGQIQSLIPQVRYRLIPPQGKTDGTNERPVHYTADFQYIENGRLVCEDVKSPPTRAKRDYVICRKLMKELYDIEILET